MLRRRLAPAASTLLSAGASIRGKFTLGQKSDDGWPLTPDTRLQRAHQWCRAHLDQGLIFHTGKLLSLCSVVATDWLVLRLAMASASVCSVLFHFLFPDPRPMRMFYGALFGLGHLVALAFFVYSKSDAFWSIDDPEDAKIYETSFKPFNMSKWEFLQIRKLATIETIKADEVLVKQGDEMPYIWLVLDGKLRSNRVWTVEDAPILGDKDWAKFQELCRSDHQEKFPTYTYAARIWAGEIYDKNYDWDAPHSWRVTFTCTDDARLLQIRRRDLFDLIKRNPHMERIMDAMQLKDLWRSRRQMSMSRLMQVVHYENELEALRGRLAKYEGQVTADEVTTG